MKNNEEYVKLYDEFEAMLSLAFPDYDESKGALYYYQNKACPIESKSYIDMIRKNYNALVHGSLNGGGASKYISTEEIEMLKSQMNSFTNSHPEFKKLTI